MWNFLRNIIDHWTNSDKVLGTIGAVLGYFAGLIFMDINTLAVLFLHWLAALVGAVFMGMATVFGKRIGEKIEMINPIKMFKNAKQKRRNKTAA